MNLVSRMNKVELKIKKSNKEYVHEEAPIVELSEEEKNKYINIPYPIMGGLSAK